MRDLGADVIVPRGDDNIVQIRNVAPTASMVSPTGLCRTNSRWERSATVAASLPCGGGVGLASAASGFTGRRCAITIIASIFLTASDSKPRTGSSTLRVAETYAPEQAAQAHRRLEAGGTRGRCVIVF